MDFVFQCKSCQGPLIAQVELQGRLVQCPHCACGTAAPDNVTAVTEAFVSAMLDHSAGSKERVLRRVRPAAKPIRFSSSRSRPAYPRSARVSRDR